MEQFIGCDAHKKFSIFVAVDEKGKASKPVRVEHTRESLRAYFQTLPAQSEIAIESMGSWYWIVDEMERAEHVPHLTNPLEAKKRMGKPNKMDTLDARGLAILLRNGTLPECWIPPRELRDQRELLRTRMALRDVRSGLKLRIYAALDRYGLHAEGISDLFGKAGREHLANSLGELPPETGRMVTTQLEAIDELTEKIEAVEQRIREHGLPIRSGARLFRVPRGKRVAAPRGAQPRTRCAYACLSRTERSLRCLSVAE